MKMKGALDGHNHARQPQRPDLLNIEEGNLGYDMSVHERR